MFDFRFRLDEELFGYTDERDSVDANSKKVDYELKSIVSDGKRFAELLESAETVRQSQRQQVT